MDEHDRTFNGTTGGEWAPPPRAEAPPSPGVAEPEPAVALDSLDMLREAVQDREAEPVPEFCLVPLPGLPWRLVCDPDFSYPQYRDWQKAGLPVKQRRGNRAPNPLDMDQAVTAGLILLNTCVGIEARLGEGRWVAVKNSKGENVTLRDGEFLAKFNTMDPISLLRKLFTLPGRSPDAPMMEASQEIVVQAGYAKRDDDEADASDPTD